MDNQRILLFVIFSLSMFFLWQAWEGERHPKAVVEAARVATVAGSDVPAPVASGALAPKSAPDAAAVPPAAALAGGGERVTLSNDLLEVAVSTEGGMIERVALKKHRDTLDTTKPYVLLEDDANHIHVAQAGLLGAGLPNHRTIYVPEPGPRELAAGVDSVQLRLKAPVANGIEVTQVLTLKRGSYLVDVAFEMRNVGAASIDAEAYFQLTRDKKPPVGQHSMVPAYTGVALYNEQDKFKKVEFSDIDKGKVNYGKTADNGWIAMLEHYFVAAWLPRDGEPKLNREFFTKKAQGAGGVELYSAGVRVPVGTVAPGAVARIAVPLYVGPQEQEGLANLAKGLDLTTDYGIFTVVAVPLFSALQWLYKLVGNWGWAIVLLTVLIKAVFYPLNATSARSMAKMRVIAPKLKALQEQFANDKQQLQIRMMELYKTEKINPLGGCLPILVQMPVFLALYWVLLAAVELRHAPWVGWIHDLSGADPYYVLPVIYAITAYLQVKLSPSPTTDPVQARMMQIMPIAFSVMFIFFPSGLVLYWLVNNILSIAQQWHVNRMIGRENDAAAGKR